MPAFIDLTGQTFGRLTVVSRGLNDGPQTAWLCACSCGASKVIRAASLRHMAVKSCGCLRVEKTVERSTKHGAACRGGKSPTYESWRGALDRCDHPSHTHWKYYGGRGITVCDEWRHDFTAFLRDMGERPEGMTVDRIDGNGNYEPGNCRWADAMTQAHNQRQRSREERRDAALRGHAKRRTA